jgi:hypothetical protein
MASDLFLTPEASDGDGYDPDPNNNAYYRVRDDKPTCEAGEHSKKFQFIAEVFEMQVRISINFIYDAPALKASPGLGKMLFRNPVPGRDGSARLAEMASFRKNDVFCGWLL